MLLALARIIIVSAQLSPPPISTAAADVQWVWMRLSPLEYSGSATGALLLGVVLPLFGNLFYGRESAKDRVLRSHRNPLFKLLHEAATARTPIAVTMANRKWYAGIVMDSPNLDPQEQYFRILPVFSGYRETESLKVQLTVYYSIKPTATDTADFVLTLPLADVKSAHRFNPDVFFEFFGNQRPPESVETVTVPEPPPETHYS